LHNVVWKQTSHDRQYTPVIVMARIPLNHLRILSVGDGGGEDELAL